MKIYNHDELPKIVVGQELETGVVCNISTAPYKGFIIHSYSIRNWNGTYTTHGFLEKKLN